MILSESLVKEAAPTRLAILDYMVLFCPDILQVSPPSSISGYCQRLFTVRLW